MKPEKEKNFISCVLYLHNDENTVQIFLDSLQNILNDTFEKYEIICVNDASGDNTVGRLKEYVQTDTKLKAVSLISMSYYQGVEAAMNAGRELAVGDFLFEFDRAVMDYPASFIKSIYEKALEGNDIVNAVPKRSVPFTSRLFYTVYNWGNRAKNKLEHESFRMISRRAVNRINQLNVYIPYRKAMYMNCGLPVATLYYDNTESGRKSMNKEEKGKRSLLAFDSFIIFTDVLEKLSLLLCGMFLVVMLVMAGYVVWSVFSDVRPVEGWMSIMGLISFGFFGVFLLLTLILKYLSVILSISFKRQRYVVESIEKLSN